MLSTFPVIEPISDSATRPFWSVMVPAFNPQPENLNMSLKSVLEQGVGPERMQIEVLDDCSTKVDIAELVWTFAGDRVVLHRESRNLGLAGIWNRCIEQAQGMWVHILHQDDFVLPGFYKNLESGILSDSSIGMAYCRHAFCDSDGHWTSISGLDVRAPGVVSDFLERIVQRQRIQTPSVVVKREVYQSVGGFRSDLKYTLDWEMWARIGSRYKVWHEPSILACYRQHKLSETERLHMDGDDIKEIRKCIKIISGYLPAAQSKRCRRVAQRAYSNRALQFAKSLFWAKKFRASYLQLIGALSCSFSPVTVWQIVVLGFSTSWAVIRYVIWKISSVSLK